MMEKVFSNQNRSSYHTSESGFYMRESVREREIVANWTSENKGFLTQPIACLELLIISNVTTFLGHTQSSEIHTLLHVYSIYMDVYMYM